MAEEKGDWESTVAKTNKYLLKKFGSSVAKRFMEYVADYDELQDITDDLENEDEDSWQNSNIVEEIGTDTDLDDDRKILLFKKLRICFGLDEETDDVTLLDQLDFNVTNEDIINARKYIIKQCPGLVGIEDQTLFKVIAIGIKNNIPLLSLLNDLYQFWRLNATKTDKIEHFSENEWVANSKYLSTIKPKEVKNLIIGALRSYSRRILPGPTINNYQFIDDSLSEYIKIINSVSAMIKNIVETSENDQSFPLQIDVWIIPKEKNKIIMKTSMMPELSGDDDDDDDDDDDNDGDDDDDNKEQNGSYIDIGSIGKLLKKDKIKYSKCELSVDNEANCIRTMRQNLDKIISNKRSIRSVMIIDRRNNIDNGNKFDLYCYQSPEPFGTISNDYCPEQLMNNTSKYIIAHPNDTAMPDNKNSIDIKSSNTPISGGFTGCGREFILSFHIHSVDKINAYVWMHGFGVKFVPKYLINVFPKYFKINDLNENKIDEKYINEKFKIKCTDPMFDAWNKLINGDNQ